MTVALRGRRAKANSVARIFHQVKDLRLACFQVRIRPEARLGRTRATLPLTVFTLTEDSPLPQQVPCESGACEHGSFSLQDELVGRVRSRETHVFCAIHCANRCGTYLRIQGRITYRE
jgi:hypothetical protein